MKTPSACVMVAVDINTKAASLIRRAARLAGTTGLRLLVVHLIEHHSGFESDHVPFLTPEQMRLEMARTAHDGLMRLVQSLGLPDAEVLVVPAWLRQGLAELVLEQQARYLVTGPLKWGFLSPLATLAGDWRLQETGCKLLHFIPDPLFLGHAPQSR
jgi:hypothetical protein